MLRKSLFTASLPTALLGLLVAAVALAQPVPVPTGARPAPRRAALPAAANTNGKRPIDRVLSVVGGAFAGAAGDFDERAAFADRRGVHHARLVQKVKGVPILGGEAIVHTKADGSFDGVTDRLLRNVEAHLPSGVVPTLTAAAAVAAAERAGRCTSCIAPRRGAELYVVPLGETAKLAYRVELETAVGGKPSRPVVLVDAMTGATLQQYENLQTAAGATHHYGTVTIATSTWGSNQVLEDPVTWKVGTFDLKGQQRSTHAERVTDADGNFNDAAQKSSVELHYAMTTTLAYLKNTHGWEGLDGSGGGGYLASATQPNVSLIAGFSHYSAGYSNAFWNGSYLACGDGGPGWGPLTSVDIVAHELGHAVVDFSSGLVYRGESGALNESFADVLGAVVERHAFGESADTWKIGERPYTPTNGIGDALRSLADPHAAVGSGATSDDDPDHYSERYTGSTDNGGVHTNSGIPNKAFYLLAKGGTHHRGGSMTGIGVDDAAKIWFLAFTQYLTSTATFADAREATVAAATSLFGATSAQATAVATAWGLVGVGAIPVTSGVVNGGFELTASPWSVSGSAFFTANGSYPQGGTGYVYLGASIATTGELSQTIVVPMTGNALKFGLNVTSSDTTNKDKMTVEVRNATGATLGTLASFTGADKAATPGAYGVRGPYSLAAYAGQSVRLVFRVTNDTTKATTFRLDNVRLE